MNLPAPAYCRPEAYELFAASVPRLESKYGLLMATVALSMHELSDVQPDAVDRALQRMADTVRSRVHSGNESALLAHAHHYLFDELGFSGDTANYYDPDNSYLPVALENRTGLPITLCLIYKNVLERLGFTVHGINAPGHFLVSVQLRGVPMIVDPFDCGKALTANEACQRAAASVRKPLEIAEDLLPRATHRQWVGRMLRNLYAVFLRSARQEDLGAVVELGRLLNQRAPSADPDDELSF